jgi:integrin beta 3
MTPAVEKLAEEIAPVIERLVVSEVERVARQTLAGIMPRDGRDGQPGVPGPPGAPGAPGEKGADGRNGRDGIDGTLEGLTCALEDRALILRRADGTELGRCLLPIVIDRGQYRAGATYAQGDAVTYSGSLWIAQAETDSRPIEGGSPWRLAVKRGEKGPAGTRGERGPTGDKGAQGLPGGRYA